MNIQKYSTVIIVGAISFLLGAIIMHYSAGIAMNHGRSTEDMREMMNTKKEKGTEMHTMDGHQMKGGEMMAHSSSTMNMGDMTMNDMAKMLEGKTGLELEKEFLTGMIPHHQGAVDMARVVLADKTTRPEIRVFAENIIKAQETEIAQMKKWLELKK
jgi:uncharacterized protein (DUF305 family)